MNHTPHNKQQEIRIKYGNPTGMITTHNKQQEIRIKQKNPPGMVTQHITNNRKTE